MSNVRVNQLPLAPLGAGDLIDRAVRLYRQHLFTLIRIAAPPTGATDGPALDLRRAAERYRALLEIDLGLKGKSLLTARMLLERLIVSMSRAMMPRTAAR